MLFSVLYQTRTPVNIPPQGNTPGEASVKIAFKPVIDPSTREPLTLDAETPEAAFTLARDHFNIPRAILAVEPFHARRVL